MSAFFVRFQQLADSLLLRLNHLRKRTANGLLKAERSMQRLTRFPAPIYFGLWVGGLFLLWLWDVLFLNAPERHLLEIAFAHSLLIAMLVVILSFLLAWAAAYLIEIFSDRKKTAAAGVIHFCLNLIRSLPQIVGVLLGYVWITYRIQTGHISGTGSMLWMSVFLALFIFPEVVALLRERIAYFRQSDFFNAMRVSGISEWRIINYDILWKNSRLHILNKMIAVFSSAIFLQCSVDFIVSVGLSTRISAVNLPVTLGSLLANIDSKQDILAIGYSLSHPAYLPNLFFRHLQGISVALVIVFTLFSLYKITNALAERFHL
ncbi:hypothetical protein DRI50_03085 [candidate division KSB1 bacterium]|nr:MAG: hypothetical protein DRI50_03085 [candidate division KSB1 bacterium]